MTTRHSAIRFRPLLHASALALLGALTLGSCDDEPEDTGDDGSAGESGGNGGSSRGGSANGGDAGAGNSTNGGATSGGSSNGGATTGGSSSGGSATGGQAGEAGAGGNAGSGAEAGAGGSDGSRECNPTATPGAQGCPSGLRCAWTRTSATTGELACVPAGSAGPGEACRFEATAPNGASYDDCRAGLVCDDTVCRAPCDFESGSAEACSLGEACVRVEGIFANQNERPDYGACYETCDPLTQTRVVNGAATTCGVNYGCYVQQAKSFIGETIAVCAPAGSVSHNQPLTPPIYANSCAPGHFARAVQTNGQNYQCAAFCKPADVYAGVNDGASGRPAYEGGDPRAPNWLNQPATCESVAGASARPEVPTTGESCRYYGLLETHDYVTRFSNTLGICVPHARWLYDPTDGNNPTTPWPRCPTLTTGDTLPPLNGRSDALDWGCTTRPPSSALSLGNGTAPPPPASYLDRIHPKP